MKLIVFNQFCSDLSKHWRELESASENYLFQNYEWLEHWQQTVGSKSIYASPFIVVFLDSSDQVRLIFPFIIRRNFGVRILEFMGGSQSDYNGPIIHSDWILNICEIHLAWRRVLSIAPKHDIRHFHKLPDKWTVEHNPMLYIWPSVFQDKAYQTLLPSTYKEFQQILRPKLKSDERRQRKRLLEIGCLRFKILLREYLDCYSSWDSIIDVMIKQKSERLRSVGLPNMFADSMTRKFYANLQGSATDVLNVHFSILDLDGRIMATHWGAVYRSRFYYLMPTFASSDWGKYSPGRLLLTDLMKWSIENGVRVFDFTIGSEEYKNDWCNTEISLFEHLKSLTPLGRLYLVYIRIRRRARRNKYIWGMIRSLYKLVLDRCSF